MIEKIATAGHVAGHDVLILADAIIVSDADGACRFPVPDYGTAIGDLAARPGFRLGWGRFPDGAEVLYLSDRDDAKRDGLRADGSPARIAPGFLPALGRNLLWNVYLRLGFKG